MVIIFISEIFKACCCNVIRNTSVTTTIRFVNMVAIYTITVICKSNWKCDYVISSISPLLFANGDVRNRRIVVNFKTCSCNISWISFATFSRIIASRLHIRLYNITRTSKCSRESNSSHSVTTTCQQSPLLCSQSEPKIISCISRTICSMLAHLKIIVGYIWNICHR